MTNNQAIFEYWKLVIGYYLVIGLPARSPHTLQLCTCVPELQ
jgi:hypothetical protein